MMPRNLKGTMENSDGAGQAGQAGDFLTPKELGARWHWNTESVRRKLRRREISSIVISGRRLIPRSEVELLERDGRIERLPHP